jgi:hypothetical protein
MSCAQQAPKRTTTAPMTSAQLHLKTAAQAPKAAEPEPLPAAVSPANVDWTHPYGLRGVRIDRDDAPVSAALPACHHCGTTCGYIEEIWTDDGGKPLLCEDCAGEVGRLEKLADELAAAPSCPEREQILDTAETTTELVNRLRAHDRMPCVACASARTSAAIGEGIVA